MLEHPVVLARHRGMPGRGHLGNNAGRRGTSTRICNWKATCFSHFVECGGSELTHRAKHREGYIDAHSAQSELLVVDPAGSAVTYIENSCVSWNSRSGTQI